MSDGEFDENCKRLLAEWDALSPLRQWQLGSPEELAASGFHIKATSASVYATAAWLDLPYQLSLPQKDWKYSDEFRLSWCSVS